MSDLYNRIMSQKGSLENLVMKIPGFRGYQESQARRQADRMLRDYLVGQVERIITRFERVEKLILDQFGMGQLSKTRDVKGKIRLYKDKINAAMPGYSGLWAQMKIGADELDELYAFDEAQIRYVEQIEAAIDAMQEAVLAGGEDLPRKIMETDLMASEALDAFALRDDLLTRVAETL